MSENLRTYTKALYGFDAVVTRTSVDQWSSSSPCEDWTAADVVAHNVGMNDMVASFCTGTGASQPSHDTASDPAAEWTRSFDGLLAALDSDGALQTVAGTPWGEMPVDKFLGFAWVDPLIHTWDLACATGQAAAMDAALVARAAKQLERAGDSLVAPGRFNAAVRADADSGTVDQLVALAGRNPRG
ncbi:MAG: TIGR03086 family protein [Actinomycetia bacterium]|nr:TIGR03086 family protein [Actinomycetes bacterium]